MAEDILNSFSTVGTNVEKGLHGRPVPAHLLFLVHALGHDLVDLSTNAAEIGSPPRRRAAWDQAGTNSAARIAIGGRELPMPNLTFANLSEAPQRSAMMAFRFGACS